MPLKFQSNDHKYFLRPNIIKGEFEVVLNDDKSFTYKKEFMTNEIASIFGQDGNGTWREVGEDYVLEGRGTDWGDVYRGSETWRNPMRIKEKIAKNLFNSI